jgi:hypothetical protein
MKECSKRREMYEKYFDKWNLEKQRLNNRKDVPHSKLRDIWWVSLGINVGYEIDGKMMNLSGLL